MINEFDLQNQYKASCSDTEVFAELKEGVWRVSEHKKVHLVDFIQTQDISFRQLRKVFDHEFLRGSVPLLEVVIIPGDPDVREADVCRHPKSREDLRDVPLQRLRLDDHLRGHVGAAKVAGEPEGCPMSPDPGSREVKIVQILCGDEQSIVDDDKLNKLAPTY